MKPPPPKLKYSNFMNIMKDEAVLDPTKVIYFRIIMLKKYLD